MSVNMTNTRHSVDYNFLITNVAATISNINPEDAQKDSNKHGDTNHKIYKCKIEH